jgi:transcriptional regulator with XRE-family HTH domain
MSNEAKKPNPVDVHVGSLIRMRRSALKMSQTTLAEALGITFQQVQKYEKGTNRVGASRLQAIAGVLSAPVSYFFDGAPGKAEPSPDSPMARVTELLAVPKSTELLEAFAQIRDGEARRKVLDIVKVVAAQQSALAQAA